MLENKDLTFPIGQLVYNTVCLDEQSGQKKQLFWGFFSSIIYGFVQMRSWFFSIRFIPESLQLIAKTTIATSKGEFLIPAIRFNLGIVPMLVSIGFIAGAMIAVPLLIGAVAQIAVLESLYVVFFNYLKRPDFIFAVSSGLVLSSALSGIVGVPTQLYKFFKKQTMNNNFLDFTQVNFLQIIILIVAFICFLF